MALLVGADGAAVAAVAAAQVDLGGGVGGAVFNVLQDQGAGVQGVQAVVDGGAVGGDGAADKVGLAANGDVIAAIASKQAALFGDAGVVAADGLVVEVGAAADACADGEAAAKAAVFAAVVVGVLEALDGEVASNVGNDVFGGANGAFHEEVAAGFNGQ
ncbi:hypothetical protein SAMN05660380_02337 [Xylella fastidiosa]|uniref:hypothetical protein n=1 Tax=Xylella fastidiosa TaxID=2371 RepID=UPI000321DF02|nr:hypothetical protein SAMN05660380_02337 [Xylella fastidiosa]